MIDQELFDAGLRDVELAENRLALAVMAGGSRKVSVRVWGLQEVPERTVNRLVDLGLAQLTETGRASLTPKGRDAVGHATSGRAITSGFVDAALTVGEPPNASPAVCGSPAPDGEPGGPPLPERTPPAVDPSPPDPDPGAVPPCARVGQEASS